MPDTTALLTRRLAAHYLACVEAEDRRSLQLHREEVGKKFIAPWVGRETLLHNDDDTVPCTPAGDTERAFMARGIGDPRGADIGFYGYPLWLDSTGRLSPLFIVPVTVEDLGGRGNDRSYLLHRTDRLLLNRYLFSAFTDEELDDIQRDLESDHYASFADRIAAALGHARTSVFDFSDRMLEALPTDSAARWVRTAVFLRDARGPFTFNLRQDLAAMARYEPVYGVAGDSAIQLLATPAPAGRRTRPPRIAELIPLNPSQEHAARSATGRPLTVVTGPPGTGKSQVVVDLLATAILSEKPILFASKNNQAVDVVRQRLREALGETMDFSLRAGNREAMDAMGPEILDRLNRLVEAGPPGGERQARSRLKAAREALDVFHREHAAGGSTPHETWRALKDDVADATREVCRAVWGRRLYREAPEVRSALKRYREALRMVGGRGASFVQSLDRVAEAQRELARYFPIWITTALSVRNAVPLRPAVFDLVVIDEASQCDLASALPLLYRAGRATVIGDPHQFRHIASIDTEVEAGLNTSTELLPEWSYVTHSIFDVAARAFEASGYSEPLFLEEHYRSHPAIISFSNTQFYDGRLTIRTDLDAMQRRLPGVVPGMFWFDVAGAVPASLRSAYNPDEIEAILAHLEGLMRASGPEVSIGVVTPFRAQIDRLKARVRDAAWYRVADRRLRVGTSHTFQGDECDIVIFSPVVAGGMRDSARRWVATTDSLLNVAVTRARAALHIVGDREACVKAGGALAALARHATAGRAAPTLFTQQASASPPSEVD